MIDRTRTTLAALAIAAFAATPLAAQQTPQPPAPEAQPAPEVAPPEPNGEAAACGARLERFIQSVTNRFDGANLTSEAQRRAYSAFRSAADKTLEFVREACANDRSAANIQQLESAEKQMEAALARLRPSLENFYSSLSDEQKAQIDSLGRQLQLWAKDFWGEFVRDMARQLNERQARPGARPDDLRFCFEGFCLSVPGDAVDGRRDRRWREPDNGDRL